MESAFVLLAEIPVSQEVPVPGLLLNVLEMWCCLIFRTLTKKNLEKYLPEDLSIPRSRMHLNVALPLHQELASQDGAVTRKKSFAELFHAADPMIQQYYRSMRKGFWDLKNSDDPKLREYYWGTYRRMSKAGAEARRQKTRRKALIGTETQVVINANGCGYVLCNHHNFMVPACQIGTEYCEG
jgi:hypothetical protein